VFSLQPVPIQRERVFQVFGGTLLKQLVEIQSEVPVFYTGDDDAGEPGGHSERIRVHGFVSKPEVHKLNRNSLYFFVNRRMVRDRIILHALNEAYRNILPAGIFPVVLLFIEMPLREVDVNVHPSKTEVRFRHQSLLHDFLRDSVRKALMEARPQTPFPAARHAQSAVGDSPFDTPLTEELAFPGTVPKASSWSDAASTSGEPASSANPLILTPLAPAPTNATLPFRGESALTISGGPSTTVAPSEIPSARSNAVVAGALPARTLVMPAEVPASGESVEPVLVAQSQFGIVPLGQIDNSFIVAADGGALLLIDQHVAHERILFEKVLRQRSEGKVESQRLLLPLIIEINPRQQVILENITPELAACGFEVEPFGRKTVAIKAAPAGLATADVQQLLGELLEGLERETQAISLTRLRDQSQHASGTLEDGLAHR
jgi:DNA mismatch repair protein MutL